VRVRGLKLKVKTVKVTVFPELRPCAGLLFMVDQEKSNTPDK